MDCLGEYDSSSSSSSSSSSKKDCSNYRQNRDEKYTDVTDKLLSDRKRSRSNRTSNDLYYNDEQINEIDRSNTNSTLQWFRLPKPELNGISFPKHDYLSEHFNRSLLNASSSTSLLNNSSSFNTISMDNLQPINNNNSKNKVDNIQTETSYANYLRSQQEFRNPNYSNIIRMSTNNNSSTTTDTTTTTTTEPTTTATTSNLVMLQEWETIHTIVQLEEQARIRQYRQQES
jgi:hypothetical protein